MKYWPFFKIILECVILCCFFLWPIAYLGISDNLTELKNNWSTERCYPRNILYYPMVSDNMTQDAVYCLQNIMKNSMGEFLQPLTYVFSNLTNLGGNLSTQLQSARGMVDYIRNSVTSIIQRVFGVFLNMIIEFQVIVVKMKDMMAKIVGIFIGLLYTLDGTVMLVESGWNGVPGQMVRALGSIKLGGCFHKNTKLKLKDGSIKRIVDIHLNDVLINGSKVVATMQIANAHKENYYSLPGGVNDEPILVTGTHYVYDPVLKAFQIVENVVGSSKTTLVDDVFYCLITDNNLIQIGRHTFWDWEDFKINRWAL
jgi:hypothetical protein